MYPIFRTRDSRHSLRPWTMNTRNREQSTRTATIMPMARHIYTHGRQRWVVENNQTLSRGGRGIVMKQMTSKMHALKFLHQKFRCIRNRDALHVATRTAHATKCSAI